MNPTVFIESHDQDFAKIICNTLKTEGIATKWGEDGRDIMMSLADKTIGVVLLDIRNHYEKALSVLRLIKQTAPGVEVLLINRPYNVWIAVEGMRAGASDEITVPLDTETLRTKITEACLRVRKMKKKKQSPLLQTFSTAMSAATFAQAGEFDTALDILQSNGAQRDKTQGTPE